MCRPTSSSRSEGSKGSASRGIGRSIRWYTERFEPDALRYAVSINFPETSDTEMSVEDMVKRVNEELVATWGNLVNRVLSMTERYFDRVVPPAAELDARRRGSCSPTPTPTLEEVGTLLDREGQASRGTTARDGRGTGGERLPQRAGAVEDGYRPIQERTGTNPQRGAQCHRRGSPSPSTPTCRSPPSSCLEAIGVELGGFGPGVGASADRRRHQARRASAPSTPRWSRSKARRSEPCPDGWTRIATCS